MVLDSLKAYLDAHNVKYVTLEHSTAYTAADVAASAHVAARDFAKTIVIMIEDSPAMILIPANRRLLLHELREMFEPAPVRLATESELKRLFPDCEVGAMPPFGNLYGVPVYVVPTLTQHGTIAFNAGAHTEIIQLAYVDFETLVRPRIMAFAMA